MAGTKLERDFQANLIKELKEPVCRLYRDQTGCQPHSGDTRPLDSV